MGIALSAPHDAVRNATASVPVMKHDVLAFASPPGAAPLPGAGPVHDRLWFKDAIVYELHVKAFADGNDDGVGDFRGLTGRLDYLASLGVNTLWLLPFFPSPGKDDGYDVSDYNHVHPAFGTRSDVRTFVREAHQRGLRVIIELVLNHTSDQHPWFQAARRAPPGSRKRAFYVWSDDPGRYAGTRIIFTDTETSNWTWDPVARAYYWHRFFSHQPDLNFDHPHVLKAVLRTMRLWLDMGVDGFRLDAIPYLVERDGTRNENLPETHAVIKSIRAWLDDQYPGRVLLAEANQWPEDVRDYFGDGDECHMAYHFPLMPRMYMALAQEDRHPIVEIMAQTPEIPETCQWAIFLRNHDELTLEMVTRDERDYLWRMYAAEPRARLNLGIRRRLAPLMDNDADRIRLMNGLLLSMPGSPVLYYGDEIGMGDNIFLGDRDGVRTPMQWSPDRNAGFSRADPQRLYLPPIMDAVYGYPAVNVEAQQRDPSSLLNWMRRMLAIRRATPAFGRGTLRFLQPGNRKVLAFLREHGPNGEEAILCVANLSRAAQPVELDLAPWRGRVPVEMMGRTAFPPIGDLPYLLTLSAYGFFWFRLATDAPQPHWHAPRLAPDDLPVLVLFDGWTSLFRDRVVPWRIRLAERTRAQFEQAILPRWLWAQPWTDRVARIVRPAPVDAGSAAGAPGPTAGRVDDGGPLPAVTDGPPLRLADHAVFGPDDERTGGPACLLTLVDAGPARVAGDPRAASRGEGEGRWFVPLSIAWEGQPGGPVGVEARPAAGPMAAAAVAKVRQQAEVGVMCDAQADPRFLQAVEDAVAEGRAVPGTRGTFRFVATAAFARLRGEAPAAGGEGDGRRLVLRLFRRLQPGPRPSLELARHLTEGGPFGPGVAVAGWCEYVAADGTPWALGLLEAPCVHQGDAWQRTLDYLARHFDDASGPSRTAAAPGVGAERPTPADVHGLYVTYARAAGRRLAALHLALARRTGDPAFDPEPMPADAGARLLQAVHDRVGAALDLVARTFPAEAAAAAGGGEGRDQASVDRDRVDRDRVDRDRVDRDRDGRDRDGRDRDGRDRDDRGVGGGAATTPVRRLLAARGPALARLDALRGRPLRGVRIRLHGDFRLGQLVVCGDDLRIAEMEGEPSALVDAPGALHAPLRDLAALLHALSAAATEAVARRAAGGDAGEPVARLAAEWLAVARDAVCDGYWHELDAALAGPDVDAASAGHDLMPDPAGARVWLPVFEADRAARALLDAEHHPADWPVALDAAARQLGEPA